MPILWTFGRLGYPKTVDELLPSLNNQFKSLEVVLRQFATRTLADINNDLGTITVDAAHLASASVTAIHLAPAAVTSSAVATSAIGASAIVNDAISAAHLKAGAVVTSAIAVGAVVASSIAADAILASKIAAGAVVTSALAAGAVTADKISVSSLAAINANIGDITAGQVRNSANTAGVFIDTFGTTVSVPAGWTRFLNLAGTSANPSFVKHDLLDLKYDGTATFQGIIDIGTPTNAYSFAFGDIGVLIRYPALNHGMSDVTAVGVSGVISTGSAGGLLANGLAKNTASTALLLGGTIDMSAGNLPPVAISGWKKNGTSRAAVGAGEPICEFWAGAAAKLRVNTDSLVPVAAGGLTLGNANLPWGPLTFKNAAGGSITAGTGELSGGGGASPTSARLAFGTDNTGWQLRFAKNASGSVTDLWAIIDGGHFLAVTDDTYDIGATGATRPKNVYVSQGVGVRHVNITSAGTGANTTETDLMTHTLPTLVDGDTVEVWATGTVTGVNDTKTINLRMAGSQIAVITCAAGIVGSWAISAVFTKDGSVSEIMFLKADDTLGGSGVAAGVAPRHGYYTNGPDISGAIVKCTGTTVNSADEVTQESLVVRINKK